MEERGNYQAGIEEHLVNTNAGFTWYAQVQLKVFNFNWEETGQKKGPDVYIKEEQGLFSKMKAKKDG